ncbi:MAG: signal peptide peptidase SppA [Pseudomonadota bacterium]
METISADALVERRRLRRSRSLWRVFSILIFILAIAGSVAQFTSLGDRLTGRGDHIARVQLSGFIGFNDPLIDLLENLEDDDDVKAIILRVNSPGGLAVAGERLYTQLRSLGDAKPLVAQVEGVGASAAYLAASAAEHIVARNGSIVGSIGVVAQFPDISGLLETVGVDVYEIRSGELKAQPSMFGPPSEEALADLESLIASNFDWFVAQIEERRGLDDAVVRGFEGTVFTGNQALDLGLIDAVGGEDEAVAHLRRTHELDDDLDVLDRAPRRPVQLAGASAVARLLSDEGMNVTVDAQGFRDSLRDAMLLDGLLSLWHGR